MRLSCVLVWGLQFSLGMNLNCLKCQAPFTSRIKYGFFVRKSDSRRLQRYKCLDCNFIFSNATFHECYRQKKRKINPRVNQFLCSGVSQRRCAILLKVNRKTVVRKFLFLSMIARFYNHKHLAFRSEVSEIQFDDLETIEHTKLKPLSVTMAVERSSREKLGFKVAQMPAKGLLAKKSVKKYGFRVDQRQ